MIGMAVLVPLLAVAGVARAAPHTDLTDPNVRLSDGFYPCPGQPVEEFYRPPYVEECLDEDVQPLRPLIVDSPTSCAADSTSTIHIASRASGFAFIPGGGWLGGELAWSLTAQIGPQTGAAVPSYQPFPDDGMRMESIGFPTGAITAFNGSFAIDVHPLGAGPEDVAGTVSLLSNGGNWGVCRTFDEQNTGNPVFGSAPVTGDFYIVNAGVLAYRITNGPEGLLGETGVGEAYLMNSLATCCDAESPTQVNSATGHFKLQFGSTHPVEGTSGSAHTPTGLSVTVTDFVGLDADEDVGGVSITFSEVEEAGDTMVTLLTSMPDQPTGFQVGDPPAVYEISTTATVVPPITVCLPYGSLPENETPVIQHYVGGSWEVVPTISDSGPPDRIICGEVDSLSPFAVGYYEADYELSGPFQPVDPQPTVNIMKAGRTVPVKFSLGGDFGLDVFASGQPSSVGGDCSGATSPVETTTAGAEGLTYDPTSGRYAYHWKTSKTWTGMCRTLTLRFRDGSELLTLFRFT